MSTSGKHIQCYQKERDSFYGYVVTGNTWISYINIESKQ